MEGEENKEEVRIDEDDSPTRQTTSAIQKAIIA